MQESTSSASRLYRVLAALRTKQGHVPTREAVGQVLEVNKDDLTLLYRGLLSLQILVDEIETSVRRLPKEQINHDLYLRSMPQIRKGLAIPNWNAQWQDSLNHLSEKVVEDLHYCDDVLSKYFPEKIIANEELKAIKDEVSALFEIVNASQINMKLRQVVLDLLDAINRAISDYQIRGSKGLREALAYSFGKLYMEHKDVLESKNEFDWQRVWSMLVKVDQIVAKAMEYKALIEPLLPLLLSGSGTSGK